MPRPPTVPSTWRTVHDGYSYWRHVKDGKGVTVFQTKDYLWKWVYDGEFDSTEYGSDLDAMDAAVEALDLE